jgi:ribosomal protein S8
MPRRSNLELQGLIDRAYDLFQHEKKTAKEIADILQKEGFVASHSGVARALRKKKIDMKRFEEAMESAKAIVQATEGRPGTDIGEATLQLTLTKLLEELRCIEDFSDMSNEKVILAVAQTTRSIAAVSRLKLDYEKGYRAGCFKMKNAAADEAEKAARKRGASDDLVAEIRTVILGLKDGST